MKRHVQTVGVREWAGDDLVDLQREPLEALDAFFAEYGSCIVQGCEITARTDDSGTFDVSAGLVALEAEDPDGTRRVMTMPFSGASGVALPLYLTASVETLTDVYGDGKSKPIAYAYTARAVGSDPGAGIPHLVLAAEGGNRFVDAVQDPEHRFVSDAERARWDRVLEQAKAYADSVSATGSEAALRNAKEYTDAREVAILAAADTKDEATLHTAKEYADRIVAALAGSAPETLDTLQELAAALGNDPNFSATVMQMIGERVTTEALNAALATVFRTGGYINASQLNDNSIAAIGNKACVVDYGGHGGLLVSLSDRASAAPLQFLLSSYSKSASLQWRHGVDANRFEDPSFRTIWDSGNLGPATASANGLMSAADKQKLDGAPRMIWGSVAADGRKVRGGNFSSYKNGNYIEITHNLGTTEYAVVATANAESMTDRRDNYISALSKGANICSMAVISGDGKNTIEASAFDFVIYY